MDNAERSIPGAVKYDSGKSPVFRGALSYFPYALEAVARVSEFGAKKYAWNGYLYVEDGINRYSDALGRHLLWEAKGEVCDVDSGLPHGWHSTWNALAITELKIRRDLQANDDDWCSEII